MNGPRIDPMAVLYGPRHAWPPELLAARDAALYEALGMRPARAARAAWAAIIAAARASRPRTGRR